LVAPSLYEGFDLPTVEAMSQGCPILASDIAVHREVLGSAAQYFEPTNLAAFVEALANLWKDTALRGNLTQMSKLTAKSFDWSRTAALTREAFLSAIQTPSQSASTAAL
jgi:glycosyltransferase involved in cell wall biosynthesis